MADAGAYASVNDLTDGNVIAREDFETMTGRKIELRGLSRAEVIRLRRLEPSTDFEALMLVMGVSRPALSIENAKAWQGKAPAGEIEEVTDTIYKLSGLGPDAGKAAYKSVRGEL